MPRPSEPIARWLDIASDEAVDTDRPLAGLRVGVKELVAVLGVGCSANSNVEISSEWTNHDVENPYVTSLRRAGASILATTTTHEFAWGLTTREGRRVVAHPRDPRRVAGGSSGGSAVAVALGVVDVAIGTDSAGSVRVPAAWCDLIGWKPTTGSISTEHTLPLSPSFDTVGVLTADVDSLERCLAVTGVAPRVGSRRIGLPDWMIGDTAASSTVLETAAAMEALGYHVESVQLPEPRSMCDDFVAVQMAEALQVHTRVLGTWPDQRDRYGPGVRARLERAEALVDSEVESARARLADTRSALRTMCVGVTLLMPATGCPPPLLSEPEVCVVDGKRFGLGSIVLPNVVPASLAGLPAVTVPMPSADGTRGVQLVGSHGRDGELLAIARDVDRWSTTTLR